MACVSADAGGSDAVKSCDSSSTENDAFVSSLKHHLQWSNGISPELIGQWLG